MVMLYSTGCPKCKVLEKKLNMKKIEYQKNNSVMEMIALGFTQAPILQVDETFMNFAEAIAWINRQKE